jgi:hypothetical protein
MLAVRPANKTKRRLERHGKAKVIAKVTYTPTGGDPRTEAKKLILKLGA